MKPMSARDIKNSTGEVIRTLRRGESILLTFRGKPLGTIEPLRPHTRGVPAIQPYEEAWTDIETELKRSTPRFASWQDAGSEAKTTRRFPAPPLNKTMSFVIDVRKTRGRVTVKTPTRIIVAEHRDKTPSARRSKPNGYFTSNPST